MSYTVLGVGAAALTASGCVWYLPAISELRAGDDRPVSARIAATACLAGWGTGAVLTLLLLTTTSWAPSAVAVALGTIAFVFLRVQAHTRRKHEEREEARRWMALRHVPASEDPRLRSASARRAFAAWLLSGLAVASVIAGALLANENIAEPRGLTAGAAGMSVSAAFLAVGLVRVRAINRPTPVVSREPQARRL